jgi:hypothetical protein
MTPDQRKGQHTPGGIPTVRVKRKSDGAVCTINEEDFNNKDHEKVTEKAEPPASVPAQKPTEKATKDEIISYLTQAKIEFDPGSTKAELLTLVK